MRHISVRDEKMYAAKNRLERATGALQDALLFGTEKQKRAARREHKAAADEWENACAHPAEHYCAPCGKTHPMASGGKPSGGKPGGGEPGGGKPIGATANCGMLVLKRAIAPDGSEFERSHDLHIVLCADEWKRLRVADLIDRQRKQETEA